MINYLYITADAIGAHTGGGIVTKNESEALQTLGSSDVWSFPEADRPWNADAQARARLLADSSLKPKLAHLYAGCFTETVRILKERGTKVVYTVAAHDRAISKAEHEALGLPFRYPHLTDPELWKRYSDGYRLADVVVVPGEAPRKTVEAYGGVQRIIMIPHGVYLPEKIAPLPKQFSVAYLGAPGPDKGLRHLFAAWKILNYKYEVLTIAGHGTEQLVPVVRYFGGGNITLRGRVEHVSEVYDACSLYVQPSATEGFGIEVLEAMAHGRPVICSRGAGAAEHATVSVNACSAQALVDAINSYRARSDDLRQKDIQEGLERVAQLTWPLVRQRYVDLWRSL